MTVEFKAGRQNDKIFDEFGNVNHNMRQSIRRGWFRLGQDLKSEVVKETKKRPRAGATYFFRSKQGKPKRHVASRSGESHADRTYLHLGFGKLTKSTSWKVHGHEKMDFGYGIAVTSKNKAPIYDEWVEFGTKRMNARPSIQNAIKATQRNAEDHFQRELSKTFERTRL